MVSPWCPRSGWGLEPQSFSRKFILVQTVPCNIGLPTVEKETAGKGWKQLCMPMLTYTPGSMNPPVGGGTSKCYIVKSSTWRWWWGAYKEHGKGEKYTVSVKNPQKKSEFHYIISLNMVALGGGSICCSCFALFAACAVVLCILSEVLYVFELFLLKVLQYGKGHR